MPMPIEVGIWRINEKPEKVNFSAIETESKLESILSQDIGVLDPDLMIIGRQVPTSFGKFIDILAVDAQGDLTVVELKRNRTPREVVAQTLDYASWVQTLTYDQLTALYAERNNGNRFEQAFSERFDTEPLESLNENHRLIIVASELDSSTERIIDYLSTNFGVPINAVFFRYFKEGENEYLARTWLVDPNQVEAQASKALSVKSGKEPWNGKDYYVAIKEDDSRTWEDCRTYGFVSAGGGRKWSGALENLSPGSRIFAYITQKGYAGVGTVEETAVRVRDFKVSKDGGIGQPILSLPLKAKSMDHDADDPELSEYIVRVSWDKTFPTEQAFRESGMFANQNVVCKLRNKFTLDRLTERFSLDA